MNEIESLVQEYERQVKLPWDPALAGAQKVWFAIYDPAQERRLRLRITDFEMATTRAKHGWKFVDLTDSFAEWMAHHEYRDAYFEQPDDMDLALQDFAKYVVEKLTADLTATDVDDSVVVAIGGLASLFGLARASELFAEIAPSIRGRLLVFFPGQRDGSNYRLLDARDGWNYLAIPITATQGK